MIWWHWMTAGYVVGYLVHWLLFGPHRSIWTWSQRISRWQQATFGSSAPHRALSRAEEEWKELSDVFCSDVPMVEVARETADVVICLAAFTASFGYDLSVEVERKMAINRKRKWRRMGDGTGYHVKDGQQ